MGLLRRACVAFLALLSSGLLILVFVSGQPTKSQDDLANSSRVLSRVKRWEDFPNATFTFDCSDRAIGFYADLEFDCMIFHLCDGQGRRVPYMCDKNTAFNQRYRVCDWDYNVDCERSEEWYYLNDLTYATEAPVDDAS